MPYNFKSIQVEITPIVVFVKTFSFLKSPLRTFSTEMGQIWSFLRRQYPGKVWSEGPWTSCLRQFHTPKLHPVQQNTAVSILSCFMKDFKTHFASQSSLGLGGPPDPLSDFATSLPSASLSMGKLKKLSFMKIG